MFDFMDMGFAAVDDDFTDTSGPYLPDASECMRCGMCISGCPTFRLFQIDEETPRRRIRTIAKILQGESIGDEERQHLNNCVQCRACEAICPSRMAYGKLFDQAQALLGKQPPLFGKLALRLIERKRLRNRIMPLLAIYLKSGMQKPVRKTGVLKNMGLANAEALLGEPVLHPLKPNYPATATRVGSVALFTGCLSETFDRNTLLASIKLLNAIGYDVVIPTEQGCCGAIHQHNGQSAAELIANNQRVFNPLEVDAVIHAATGCGAMLSEYDTEGESADGRFRKRLYDINEFLLANWPENLVAAPLKQRVAVHEPCSQRNVLKNQASVYALLEKIPELSVSALADNHICCGAGGSYMLTHPENAGQLRTLKRQSIKQSQADLIVSSNFACGLFISQGPEVIMHPIVLLAGQLAD
ncbi:MAG: (Fe-S)-binding protein [Gammaproteobacteria bacterium]